MDKIRQMGARATSIKFTVILMFCLEKRFAFTFKICNKYKPQKVPYNGLWQLPVAAKGYE